MERLQPLLDSWQQRLRLQDWDIRLSPEPPDVDSVGSCDHWALKQVAAIRILDDPSHAVLERTLVHELLHIVLRDIRGIWRSAAADHLPPSLLRETESAVSDAEEIAIERIAGALTGMPYVAPAGAPDDIYKRTFGARMP